MTDKGVVCLFKDFDQTYLDLFETKYETLFFDLIKITPYNRSSIESIFTSEKIKAYDSIIITSKNTVAILNSVLEQHNIKDISHITTYVISKKNMEMLRFTCKDVVAANGYADDLCLKMKKDIQAGHIKNVLFICGKRRLDTMPSFLSEQNIKFDELKVYGTDHAMSQKTKEIIMDLAKGQKKVYFVFFSPSGVEAFRKVFNEASHPHIWYHDQIKFASIGTTTADPLKQVKKDILVARLPEPKYMFEALSME